MFSLRFIFKRVIPCTCNNVVRFYGFKDPGVSKRLNILPITSDELDISEIEDLESDFMEVDKSYNQHQKEVELLKEKEKFHIVRQKYFKEKHPNFLTWNDKEQIRYLYRTNPDEWNIENLSNSFPALPETIKKIVKSQWTKTKQHKIENHDNGVKKNWEMFKNRKLDDLPRALVDHLKKFTDRSLNFTPFKIPENSSKIIETRLKIRQDFSKIITSYEEIKNKSTVNNVHLDSTKIEEPPEDDTFFNSKSQSRKPGVTLKELQSQIQKKVEIGKVIENFDKLIIENVKSEKPVKTQECLIDLKLEKKNYNNTSVGNYVKKSQTSLSHLTYPEKIEIPDKIFKKGYTFKLNDCYYDDDGEFLYRVPGMD